MDIFLFLLLLFFVVNFWLISVSPEARCKARLRTVPGWALEQLAACIEGHINSRSPGAKTKACWSSHLSQLDNTLSTLRSDARTGLSSRGPRGKKENEKEKKTCAEKK